jgi:hypothetical protein
LAAVISDGAGSTQFGGQGAALICRTISECARIHFSKNGAMPGDSDIWSWVDETRDRIASVANRRATELRQFAATLVSVVASDSETLILHVGDGAAVLRVGGEWIVPSWPANGEYASTTYFVTDEPSPQLRITRLSESPDAIAVFSDGMERLALDFSSQRAHAPFFDGIFKPIWPISQPGRVLALNAALHNFLDGPDVNNRTDDDKSLILAVRK